MNPYEQELLMSALPSRQQGRVRALLQNFPERKRRLARLIAEKVKQGVYTPEQGYRLFGDAISGKIPIEEFKGAETGKPLSRRTKKETLKKRGRRKMRGEGALEGNPLERLEQTLARGGEPSQQLLREVEDALPESIRGPLESEVMIPQRESDENQRRLRQQYRSAIEEALAEDKNVVAGPSYRSELARFLEEGDIEAFEQELEDAYVKQGLSREDARRSAESVREEMIEAERVKRPSDLKTQEVPTAIKPGTEYKKPAGSLEDVPGAQVPRIVEEAPISSRKYTSTGEPLRTAGKYTRTQERKQGAYDPKDSPGKDDPVASTTRPGPYADRSASITKQALEAKKAATFSVKSGKNEYQFVPNKQGNFDVKFLRNGRPQNFPAANIRELARLLGVPTDRFGTVAHRAAKLGISKGVKQRGRATLVNAFTPESLFEAVKNNPQLGALTKNPKFLQALRDMAEGGSPAEYSRQVGAKSGERAKKFAAGRVAALEEGRTTQARKISELRKAGRLTPLLMLAMLLGLGGAATLGGDSEGA